MENSLFSDIKKYIDLNIEKIKLDTIEKTADLTAKLIWLLIVSIFTFLIVAFLLVLLYLLLNKFIENSLVALLIEFGILSFFFLIMYMLRKKLVIIPISNLVVKVLTKKTKNL